MKKLEALRRQIVAALPELQHTPERLLTFVDDGAISWHAGTTYDHRYTYECQIIITDYTGDLDALVVPVLSWLSVHNPDVPRDQAIRFEAEILSNDAYDLHLFVRLDERVRARANCATREISVEHITPEHEDAAGCGPGEWALYVRNHREDPDYRLVAQWNAAGNPIDGK